MSSHITPDNCGERTKPFGGTDPQFSVTPVSLGLHIELSPTYSGYAGCEHQPLTIFKLQ